MKAKATAMTETMQWTPIDPNKTSNADDRLITQASPHMMAIYQVYENKGGESYAAIMWDGTSLYEYVPVNLKAQTIKSAKRACEQHFATGEAEQRLQAILQEEMKHVHQQDDPGPQTTSG
jgi:hypothetical protein